MKKQVKKYGTTLIINFTAEEGRVNDIKVGDVVEVTLLEKKDGS